MDAGTIFLGLFAASCLTGLAAFVVGVELSARRQRRMAERKVTVPDSLP